MVVPIGFDFDFYGSTLTNIGLSTNGNLSDGGPLGVFAFPGYLPTPAYTAPTITPVGSVFASNSCLYETKEVAPNRVFIAQWDAQEVIACGSLVKFQAKLFESSNAIEFHHASIDDGGSGCSLGALTPVGFQQDMTNALGIDCGDPGSIAAGRSYRLPLGRESDLGITNELNKYVAPATDGSTIGSITVIDGVNGADLFLASTHVAIIENDGACATAAHNIVSSPANPTIFSSINEPTLGGTWIGQVDTTGFPNVTATSASTQVSSTCSRRYEANCLPESFLRTPGICGPSEKL